MEKKLYRDEHRKVVSGVCAGLAEYFGIDVSIVRVIFVLGIFLKGFVVLPYFILWAVLPKRPFNYNEPFRPGVTPGYNPNYQQAYGDVKVDYTVPNPPFPGQPFQPVKKASNVGVMFGVILIALGTIFLLDQIDIIPDFDFEKLWPVVLVAVGATLIFNTKKQPWEKEGWAADKKEADFTAQPKTTTTEENLNDNTPTV
ncbi:MULTISPECIES: PspC domain-containing protein [unclassified Mucilaginibacter]|uniref:PspC domain-containing protein n=1 Tax=unclassified Mucilaginibacter TaxID=2617802 RepID=UPI002AC98AE2|nr:MULTISPECIES: PspC domain-containing protein [unclassified Mucilaginibacter]MEB0261166.1 PspC domain-containing protein [Mucilaginibacter sp. 10I4]MEB0280338.1 PspC domain-containing protein [Mucilaginibacter sp. 10B2]MEB0300359.1 PspC domain-containing protein [Mucilaginibacter sp. 5C4]WPX24571.1 PspC domain-containing protein [Mucilaginibacter sp. 5C4]